MSDELIPDSSSNFGLETEEKPEDNEQPAEKPYEKKKSFLKTVSYQNMTTREILDLVKPRKRPGFRNKRQLCEWLEKNKEAVVKW